MKITQYLLIASLLAASFSAKAQSIESSTSQVISSKAAKGELARYEDEGGQIKLTYLLKQGKKDVDLETYVFDKNTLDFVESKTSEMARSEFEGSRPAPANYDRILRIYPNIATGKPKIKLGTIEYFYAGRALMQNFIVKEELTPKGDAGEKMYYVHHRTAEADKNQKIFAGRNLKVNVGDVQLVGVLDQEPRYTAFASRVFDAKDLTTKHSQDYTFDYSYIPLSAENLPNGDVAVLLRSAVKTDIFNDAKANQKMAAQYSLADDYHLKYVQLNPEGELVRDVNLDFADPGAGTYYTMNVDIVAGQNDEMMVMGSYRPMKMRATLLPKHNGPKPVYENEKAINHHKAEHFFVIKIKGDKQVYSKDMTVNAPVQNVITTGGIKAPKDLDDYVGKFAQHFLRPTEFYSYKGKDLVLMNKQGSQSNHIMQLSADGDVEANYLIGFGKGMQMSEEMRGRYDSNGDLVIFTFQQPLVKEGASSADFAKAANQKVCSIQQVDPVGKTISEALNVTPGGTIDPYDPYFFENDDSIVTLGNGRKKEIILTRVSLK